MVSLLIGGRVHSDWTTYRIDSDLLIPADAWQVSLAAPRIDVPTSVREGELVEVRVGNDTVLSGRIDEIDHEVGKNQHTLMLCGRDGAAVLVDCSAPIFVSKQITLAEVIANVVKPLGISRIRVEAGGTATYDKVNVDPCDTAWDVLTNAAEGSGLWPWFDPDGTLVIGGPDYSKPPVASLVMRRDGKGNNLVSLGRQASIADRYSEITALAQSHGTSLEAGKHALKATARDTGVSYYRPKIVVDHDAPTLASVEARARKLLADSRLRGMTLSAVVRGHRTSDGILWTPGQRIHVLSEPHGIDGIYFLMGRRFEGGRGQVKGARTTLALKEDGVWVLDAHPHTKRKRHRKQIGPGEILSDAVLMGQ
ncbi:phage baseplate assembly protein [Cupriavidus basilensis]|uniref:phage baseplate assembly protein n=1 Tax=Cupriavidus basilensis TaxID=68895 RepID=UPI0039F6776B